MKSCPYLYLADVIYLLPLLRIKKGARAVWLYTPMDTFAFFIKDENRAIAHLLDAMNSLAQLKQLEYIHIRHELGTKILLFLIDRTDLNYFYQFRSTTTSGANSYNNTGTNDNCGTT